jgi:hypothetical protein
MERTHHGQHRDCFGCKVRTLSLDSGRPKTHVHKGSHWKANPVAERIKELSGVEIEER